MTAPKQLTRKVGPLPVYAWALAIVGAYLTYRVVRGRSSSAGSSLDAPQVAADQGSGAQQPAGGQGTAADNGNSDLMDALGANTDASNALLAAVQATGGGGGYGSSSGSSGGATATGAGTDTAAVTAPTVDSGVNNAPTDPYAAAVASAQSTSPDYALIASQIPGSGADQGYALENAVLGNTGIDYTQLDAQLGIPSTTDIAAQLQAYGDAIPNPVSSPVTAPTPTVVQPAPVDAPVYFQPSTGATQTARPATGVWAT